MLWKITAAIAVVIFYIYVSFDLLERMSEKTQYVWLMWAGLILATASAIYTILKLGKSVVKDVTNDPKKQNHDPASTKGDGMAYAPRVRESH